MSTATKQVFCTEGLKPSPRPQDSETAPMTTTGPTDLIQEEDRTGWLFTDRAESGFVAPSQAGECRTQVAPQKPINFVWPVVEHKIFMPHLK